MFRSLATSAHHGLRPPAAAPRPITHQVYVPALTFQAVIFPIPRVRTLPPPALERRGGLRTRNRVTVLQAEMARLEKNARALEQAGQQLKDLWAEQEKWPTGADAYGAAARLALVAYLMGETPVLSCPSGRDYNKRLDAEVKVLATVTDCRGGQVPPPDLDTDVWDTARAAFREH